MVAMKKELRHVIRPSQGRESTWDVDTSDDGIVHTLQERRNEHEYSPPGLLLPGLCHPHIHLDKPFILTCQRPEYADLAPRSGSFAEALSNTSRAKERYTADDLYLRGSQLLAGSYEHGVTTLRAFVEVDHVTGTLPLTTAIRLKDDFSHLLNVQICVFAQDPIFSSPHGEANRTVLQKTIEEYSAHIDVLGTTPYVEKSREASLENIEWAITTALQHDLLLDFHLDYNLDHPPLSGGDGDDRPLTWDVLDLLDKHGWNTSFYPPNKTVVLGHCTQLTTFTASDLRHLTTVIASCCLPVHFVGLPTSDIFMMGRPPADEENSPAEQQSPPHTRPRGTLQVVSMIREFGLSACLGVNNVGNAFTPYGTGDPLQLASWGVGLYHAGTVEDARTLYGCVSWRARRAIGLEGNRESSVRKSAVTLADDSATEDVAAAGDVELGQPRQPMLLVRNKPVVVLPGKNTDSDDEQHRLKVPARQRLGYEDVVWDPPDLSLRSIV